MCPLLLLLFACGHVGEAKRRRSVVHCHRPRRRADLSCATDEVSFLVTAALPTRRPD